MIFYASKPITDALKTEIASNYQTYLSEIESKAKMSLKSLQDVKVGVDYQSKRLEKPFCLIDPKRLDIDDEAVGIVNAVYGFDVVFAFDGFDEEDAATAIQLYADAFVSMVQSDDFFGGKVDHATVPNIEYYPGASSVARYAILELDITLEIER